MAPATGNLELDFSLSGPHDRWFSVTLGLGDFFEMPVLINPGFLISTISPPALQDAAIQGAEIQDLGDHWFLLKRGKLEGPGHSGHTSAENSSTEVS